jgi:hypothetical protein
MQVYLNECSFHDQFFDRESLEQAVKIFFNLIEAARELKQEFSFYCDRGLSYTAYKQELLIISLNHLADASLRVAVFDVLFNKLNARNWKEEQIHSSTDSFLCDEENVTDTSVAELCERRLRDDELVGVLVNFPNSKYAGKLQLSVSKNGELGLDVDCVETKEEIGSWLNLKYPIGGGIADHDYDLNSKDPPRDYQTVLRDVNRFERTGHYQADRKVFKELQRVVIGMLTIFILE